MIDTILFVVFHGQLVISLTRPLRNVAIAIGEVPHKDTTAKNSFSSDGRYWPELINSIQWKLSTTFFASASVMPMMFTSGLALPAD